MLPKYGKHPEVKNSSSFQLKQPPASWPQVDILGNQKGSGAFRHVFYKCAVPVLNMQQSLVQQLGMLQEKRTLSSSVGPRPSDQKGMVPKNKSHSVKTIKSHHHRDCPALECLHYSKGLGMDVARRAGYKVGQIEMRRDFTPGSAQRFSKRFCLQ